MTDHLALMRARIAEGRSVRLIRPGGGRQFADNFSEEVTDPFFQQHFPGETAEAYKGFAGVFQLTNVVNLNTYVQEEVTARVIFLNEIDFCNLTLEQSKLLGFIFSEYMAAGQKLPNFSDDLIDLESASYSTSLKQGIFKTRQHISFVSGSGHWVVYLQSLDEMLFYASYSAPNKIKLAVLADQQPDHSFKYSAHRAVKVTLELNESRRLIRRPMRPRQLKSSWHEDPNRSKYLLTEGVNSRLVGVRSKRPLVAVGRPDFFARIVDYIPGISLEAWLLGTPSGARFYTRKEEFLFVMEKLVAAMTYIHKRGVLHCDPKPQNIVYNESTQKMSFIDLEFCRLRTNQSYRSFSGTLPYCTGFYSGKGVANSISSDIHALIVTMIVMMLRERIVSDKQIEDAVRNFNFMKTLEKWGVLHQWRLQHVHLISNAFSEVLIAGKRGSGVTSLAKMRSALWRVAYESLHGMFNEKKGLMIAEAEKQAIACEKALQPLMQSECFSMTGWLTKLKAMRDVIRVSIALLDHEIPVIAFFTGVLGEAVFESIYTKSDLLAKMDKLISKYEACMQDIGNHALMPKVSKRFRWVSFDATEELIKSVRIWVCEKGVEADGPKASVASARSP